MIVIIGNNWQRYDDEMSWRKDAAKKRQSIVLNLLEKKPMRWSELKKSLIGESKWFKIERNLAKTLKSLEEETKIVRIKKSHKNVSYMLSEDSTIFLRTFSALKQKEELMPKVWEEINQSKHDLTKEQAKNWIMALIFFGLEEFLFGLEHTIRTEDKWAHHARWMLNHFIDTFGSQLLMLGEEYPNLMDSAIKGIDEHLELLALHYAPKESETRMGAVS